MRTEFTYIDLFNTLDTNYAYSTTLLRRKNRFPRVQIVREIKILRSLKCNDFTVSGHDSRENEIENVVLLFQYLSTSRKQVIELINIELTVSTKSNRLSIQECNIKMYPI